jgi:hypothetical protein
MEVSLSEIKECLLFEFKNDHTLSKAIEEVGKIFNHMRDNLSDYHDNEKLISAYVAYYFTTNLPKFAKAIEMAGVNLDQYDNLVDIGTGPGTFVLAAKAMQHNLKLYGVDHSDLMLKQAKKIFDHFYDGTDVHWSKKLMKPESGKTLYLFSHSLNEMDEGAYLKYLEQIAGEDILLIEPGTKESFKKVLNFREAAIAHQYQVHFPCHKEIECPMDPDKDWCHQYMFVSHAQDVEVMTQKLGRNRRLLPICIQYYRKSEKVKSKTSMLVRVLRPTKHSLEWVVCYDNQLINLEIPLKQFSKKEAKEMHKVTAGHSIEYEVIKELPGKLRVKLLNFQL